jgi:nicotinate-nucleotide--dimethylbenzimidazole phosphoribosyltransferase
MISTYVRDTIAKIRPLYNAAVAEKIRIRWDSLTKPPGSLGHLEDLLLHYGMIRQYALPALQRKGMVVFCGDHGVARAGVSAFPQEVTREMVKNFLRGGAAINVLCRRYGIEPLIVDCGVIGPAEPGVVNLKIAEGTVDFTKGPAMTVTQTNEALEGGIKMAIECNERFDVVGIGEMGIGNSTSAAAILSAASGWDAAETAGRGTGINDTVLKRKLNVIRSGLTRHKQDLFSPFGILRNLGSFEIGMMTGFLLGAAACRLPVMVDGFITGSAAVLSRGMAPDSLDVAMFSHRSSEHGHKLMLEFLSVEPQFDLAMRLGEGTGAAIAIHLLETALHLYREMATFKEASVPGAISSAIQ